MALIKVGNSLLKTGNSMIGRNVPELPDGMLVLDYFVDGYRFLADGITYTVPTGYADNIPTSTGYIPVDSSPSGSTYFDCSGTDFASMPYAEFDGPASPAAFIVYSGFSAVLQETGAISLEFLSRFAVQSGGWVNDLFHVYSSSGSYKIMPNYSGSSGYFAYTSSTGSWYWGNSMSIQSPSVGNSNSNYYWNHFYFNMVLSGSNTVVTTYSNGKHACGPFTVRGIMDGLEIPCTLWEANGIGSNKMGPMQFAQIGIYDHVVHNENFTVPTVPLLWAT